MLSADGLPTRLVVTRSGMRTRRRSTARYPCRFTAVVDALLPLLRVRDCGTTLSPRHFRRDGSTGKLLRTFEMVAASKPTSRLSRRSHFLYH